MKSIKLLLVVDNLGHMSSCIVPARDPDLMWAKNKIEMGIA